MDRKPLFAQFAGDEVDGKFYALGEELAENVDFGTVEFLTASGRFAAAEPGEEATPPADPFPPVANMSRAALLDELVGERSDAELRDAVERKRAAEADDADDDDPSDQTGGEGGEGGEGGDGGDGDPLAGNGDKAIEYANSLSNVEELTALRAREVEGKDRSTVLAAIDKRAEAVKPAA